MYYHYTNRHGALAITSTGYLKPSAQSGAFGPGVYLTDLDPHEFFRDEILANNYGGIKSEFHNRADWVVEVSQNNIDIHLLRQVHVPTNTDRRIFLYPSLIYVNRDQIYDKPRCLKGYIDDDDDDDDTSSETEDSCSESEDVSFESGSGISFTDESVCDGLETDENGDGSYTSVDDENESDGSGGNESGGSSESGNDESGSDENGDDSCSYSSYDCDCDLSYYEGGSGDDYY